MDTARYSVAQYHPQNIFETTVFKTLPPVFPVPVSCKKSGKMWENNIYTRPRETPPFFRYPPAP